MVDLFDQLVTLNPCPITAATFLEALASMVDTLYIRSDPELESSAEVSSHTRNDHTKSKELLETIRTKSQSMWSSIILSGSLLRVWSGNRSMDCLLAALARLLVLCELLQSLEKSSEVWPQGALLEMCNCGEVALNSALQQLHRMLDTIRLYKLYSCDTYVRLLERTTGSASKSLAMECLTKSLVRKASSVKSMSTDMEIEEQSFIDLLYNILDMRLSDPLVLDMSLKLRGAVLAYHYMFIGNLDTVMAGKLEAWIRMLKLAGHERSVCTL